MLTPRDPDEVCYAVIGLGALTLEFTIALQSTHRLAVIAIAHGFAVERHTASLS